MSESADNKLPQVVVGHLSYILNTTKEIGKKPHGEFDVIKRLGTGPFSTSY